MRQVGFDVLVIGSGTAGYTLALTCSKAGLKVAVVDSGSYGGTCGARGCEPEQYLAEAARVAQLSRQMSEIGVYPPGSVDWPALIRSKNAFTSGVPDRAERSLEQAGVAAFFGTARFISPAEVMIGDDTTVRARAVVIATGAHPAPLEFPGAELAISTDQFLELPMLPRRVLFIGGGCLSLSFAHVARAAGAAVTVLQRGERILKRFDAELAGLVANSCHDLGIKIVTGVNAGMVERYRDAFITYGEAGCAEPFPSDIVVNTTGRFATLDRLDLASGGVTRSAHGVQVDEFLQSVSNPGVWAIGDACESPFQLSTVADMQGEVVAENIIKGKQRRPDYQGVPSVAYCQPPLAAVGLTQEQAANSGLSFRISRGDMTSWPSSRRIGQRHAFYKVLIEAQTEKILGAHLFCHNAGEVINVFAMAMKFGLTTSDLQQVLWTYPTNVSDIKEMIS
jgi:glutathione reductase (NADPH)